MSTELSPRERVRLALEHKETDRVPVDFIATDEFWVLLQQHLRLPDREAVNKFLGVDLRHPEMEYIGPSYKRLSSGGYIDYWGIRWEPQPYEGGVYYEAVGTPLADIKDASELENYPWPDPEWFDVKNVAEEIAAWDKETEYAIAMMEFGDPGGPFEISGYMRGWQQLMQDMALRPDIAFELMRHINDFIYAKAERILHRLGNRVDLIWTSDDIAHQRSSLISLPMWNELIRPHHERLNRRVHELGGRIMYHVCGAVEPFIPDLIEAGVDVLDVLQWSAVGMVPEDLKRNYGDRLSFHGGLDVQAVLPRLPQEDIRKEVNHIISVMSQDGGYIMSPSHNVQVDTPPVNLVAAYEEAGSINRKGSLDGTASSPK